MSDDVEDDAPTAGASAVVGGSSRKRARVLDEGAAAASATPSELSPEALAGFEAAERRKGLIYLSRVPPYMKPAKLRHLLSPFGELGKIYMAPEDPAVQRKRVQTGGNKKLRFTEAWVEFLDKRQAKVAAATLNNKPVETKKRSFYAGDLWNMRYLSSFKWHHLAEKMAYEKRIRAAKLRAELSVAKKEAEAYVARADLARKISTKDARGAAAGGGAGGRGGGGDEEEFAAAGAALEEGGGARRKGKRGSAAAGEDAAASDDGRGREGGVGRREGGADDAARRLAAGDARPPSSSSSSLKRHRHEEANEAVGGAEARHSVSGSGGGGLPSDTSSLRRHFKQRQPLPDSTMRAHVARTEAAAAALASKAM